MNWQLKKLMDTEKAKGPADWMRGGAVGLMGGIGHVGSSPTMATYASASSITQ